MSHKSCAMQCDAIQYVNLADNPMCHTMQIVRKGSGYSANNINGSIHTANYKGQKENQWNSTNNSSWDQSTWESYKT